MVQDPIMLHHCGSGVFMTFGYPRRDAFQQKIRPEDEPPTKRVA